MKTRKTKKGKDPVNLTEQRRRVERLVNKYKVKLGLATWKIEIEISKESGNEDQAHIQSNATYEQAHVVFYQNAFKNTETLDLVVRHELSHCLTGPLFHAAYDLLQGKLRTHDELDRLNENLTEKIAKLI